MTLPDRLRLLAADQAIRFMREPFPSLDAAETLSSAADTLDLALAACRALCRPTGGIHEHHTRRQERFNHNAIAALQLARKALAAAGEGTKKRRVRHRWRRRRRARGPRRPSRDAGERLDHRGLPG